jgi:hypothetical protein
MQTIRQYFNDFVVNWTHVIKNSAYFLILIFITFMIAPVIAVNSTTKCVCNKVPITWLKLHVLTKITPIKIGFIGFNNNPNTQVYCGLSPFLEKQDECTMEKLRFITYNISNLNDCHNENSGFIIYHPSKATISIWRKIYQLSRVDFNYFLPGAITYLKW